MDPMVHRWTVDPDALKAAEEARLRRTAEAVNSLVTSFAGLRAAAELAASRLSSMVTTLARDNPGLRDGLSEDAVSWIAEEDSPAGQSVSFRGVPVLRDRDWGTEEADPDTLKIHPRD